MVRKLRINGSLRIIPKGISVDSDDGKNATGYVKIRIQSKGHPIVEHIGPAHEDGILDKAILRLNELRDNIRSGKLNQTQKVIRWTVEKACDYYWEHEGKKKPSQDTIHICIKRMKEFFGQKFLDQCTFQDTKDYRDWLGQRGLKTLNINRHHTYWTRLFNIIKLWRRTKVIANVQLPEENPGPLVTRPKEVWRKKVLTLQEFDSLILAASDKLRRILVVGINTLLRCKDMDGLLLSKNVNWSQNCLEGLQAKVGNEFVIPINSQVMAVLTSTPEGQDKPLDFTNFRKEFIAMRNKAGIKDLKMTDIRRTGARWMLKSGIDIATVSRYLGHTSIEMTQRYVGADTTDMRRGALVLETLFKMPVQAAVVVNQ